MTKVLYIASARSILKSSLKQSRDLSAQIIKTGASLRQSKQRLLPLESAINFIAQKCYILKIRGHIDHAVGPAAAVLEVFDMVNSLEESLLKIPCSDLFHYLSLMKQLAEALRFLTNNSGLVICWLEDVLKLLEKNKIEDDLYLSSVRKFLSVLWELQAKEKMSCLCGGPLFIAMEKLQNEFQLILVENTFPMALSSTSSLENASICPNSLPIPVIQKLQAILLRIDAHNRIEKFLSVYVQVRSSNIKSTIECLDLDYLDLSLSEFDSVQSIESYIAQWGTNLEFVVKHVLELEYRLCNEVFQKVSLETWEGCFSEIAIKSGIQNFIKFGKTITKGKKDAMKLLKLLDIFGTLNNLRLDFNRVFGGKACADIRTQMRDLIKKIINGACEIFRELSVQVELQRGSSPPTDGSVPRLVSFIIQFCNELLEDDRKVILIQVLEIHTSWQNKSFEDDYLSKEIYKITKEIELNLETWVKTYENTSLSYLFMMNNHCCLSKNMEGTKLGDLMGESWLRTHEQAMEHYAAMYLRGSWARLPSILTDGLVSVSGSQATKKRLTDFNDSFDEVYKEQCKWVISDKNLRSKICELVGDIIFPVYRSFVQLYYTGIVEQGTSSRKSVKYSTEELEDKLSCLFQPKLGTYTSNTMTTCTQLVENIPNVVISQTAAAGRVF